MSGIVGGNLGRGSGLIKAGAIDDNAVTLAKMAGLARGTLIYGDTSGDPAALAAGGADEVLTHDGTDFDWAAAGGGVNTPLFRARLSSSFSVSNEVYQKIAFDTCSGTSGGEASLDFINGGTFDATADNYKWTPGEAGYYYIGASLYAYDVGFNADKGFHVFVKVNDTSHALQGAKMLQGGVACAGILYLTNTDYVSVEGRHNLGTDALMSATHNMTFFCGHKIIS